jgi:hypothetical protein
MSQRESNQGRGRGGGGSLQQTADIDVDAEHNPMVSRRASNAALRRELEGTRGASLISPLMTGEVAGAASGSRQSAGDAQQLATNDAGTVAVANPHHSKKRVADASDDQIDAVIKVVVYVGNDVVQQTQMKSVWEGPLPVRYEASKSNGGWHWNSADASSIRVNTDRHGHGGQPVESWAKRSATRIVIYAHSLGDVTQDEDAAKDAMAPGHVDKEDAGDGSTNQYDAKHDGHGDHGSTETNELAGGSRGADSGIRGGTTGATGSDKTPDGVNGKSDSKDDEIADEFEAELGIENEGDEEESDDEVTIGDSHGGDKVGGQGEKGGDVDGEQD